MTKVLPFQDYGRGICKTLPNDCPLRDILSRKPVLINLKPESIRLCQIPGIGERKIVEVAPPKSDLVFNLNTEYLEYTDQKVINALGPAPRKR